MRPALMHRQREAGQRRPSEGKFRIKNGDDSSQAIADLVELLAVDDLHPEADPSAYVAALRAVCEPDIARLVGDASK